MKGASHTAGGWGAVLIDVAGFQIVWLCSAFGAAAGSVVPGVAASLAFVCIQIWRSPEKLAKAKLVAVAGFMGLLTESMLAGIGAVHHAAPWPSEVAAPVWIIGLWMAFATTLGTLGRWLGRRRLAIAMIAGAILGPVSYLAGARLEALSLGEPMLVSLISIAGAWAVAMPLLLWVAERLDPTVLDARH